MGCNTGVLLFLYLKNLDDDVDLLGDGGDLLGDGVDLQPTNQRTDQPTNQLTWVGARDTCVSKKQLLPGFIFLRILQPI